MAELNTYGDLKKIIKSIATKQKLGAIGGVGKEEILNRLISAAGQIIPGIGLAKTSYDVVKALVSKPDTKKTNTWLDKLDIDDKMAQIVDNTVENGFMQAIAKSIESEPDDKPLESDFNMNAKMVNYLKQQYGGRHITGITENMELKEYIKSLIRKQLEEESTTAGVGGYLTPKAFSPNKALKNAATKYAMKMGWKLAGGMPKNSKVYDYKELWKGKKSAMNENMSEQEALKQIRPLLAHTIEHNKLPETFDELLIKIKNGDDDILDQMWDLAGSAIDKHAINVLSKPKNMNETLRKLIEQELLNEVTYSKFKKDVKHRTKSEQLHKAIREVKRKLQEIDRIVEYTSRMKQELSEDEGGISYWKATQNNIGKISEMVSHLNNKIKNLHQ
jgi:hypothetical protein